MHNDASKCHSCQELEAEVFRLKFEIANLKKAIFGQKRERFIPLTQVHLKFFRVQLFLLALGQPSAFMGHYRFLRYIFSL